MASTENILGRMRVEPGNIRFSELLRVCEEYFGKPRHSGGSHVIFKTPWIGDPRINIQNDKGRIQNDKGRAKTYQVRQVLFAIEKLKGQP